MLRWNMTLVVMGLWIIVAAIPIAAQEEPADDAPAAEAPVPEDERPTGDELLFPHIEPFKSGHLKVSDIHEIYFECSGNPDGKPVMTLHGGPGFGSYPRMRQYFNPEKYLIVLHDQRGAGRSRPAGEIRENTTRDLVGDVEKLRRHLGLGQVLIFGGSWGSTLGLAYAEAYPEAVSGLILRGIFTATHAEVEHHYVGARLFFPVEHAALLEALPEGRKDPMPSNLLVLAKELDRSERMKVIRALAAFEIKMMKLEVTDAEIHGILANYPEDLHFQLALIDLHYAGNGYFLEEGQLLRDAGRIAHIPAILVNGRYDMVCPPHAAWEMHRRLDKSELVIVEQAGHVEGEEGITSALVEAAARFE